jgi:predicted nucleic acid-binding protein
VSDFLLDTNVLSEFGRSAIPPHPNVKRWVEAANPDTLFTSVLCLGEIRKGIELLPPSRKRSELEQWLNTDLNGWFGKNLLPVTKAVSHRWGALDAQMQLKGRPLGNIDGLIAATALEHGLTVITCNTRHFEGLGVTLFDRGQSKVAWPRRKKITDDDPSASATRHLPSLTMSGLTT